MALGLAGRLTKAAYTIAAGAGKVIGAAEKAATSNTAKKIVGKVGGGAINTTFKTAANVGRTGTRIGLKLSQVDWKGVGAKVGKHIGMAGSAVATDVKAVNNAAGIVTGGFNIKPLNQGLNKLLNTNKFDGKKWGALVKNNPNAVLTGKSLTGLGTIAVVGAGTVIAAGDAAGDHLRARAGVNTGLASNAPVNTYSGDQTFPTMGASYANNAGATGDLALSLHRQRHSGIL
jgi:hypothetical protein